MSQPIQLLKMKTDETLETLTEHNHDNLYSKLDHEHTGTYAPVSHTHDDYTTKEYTDATYSTKEHTHDSTYASITHDHNNTYATTDHAHDEYSLKTHNHTGTYATTDHTHTGYATTNHHHNSTYAAKEHTHSGYATKDTEEILENKTLKEPQIGKPTLLSQTFTLNATDINPTTITLPAYSGITSYTLLTSQDIEAYKSKHVISEDTLTIKPLGFGLSHFHMTVSFNTVNANEELGIVQIFTYLLAEGESVYATRFLLDTAEPFSLTLAGTGQLGCQMTIKFPLIPHVIEAGKSYIIDTLLPTPPSGWIAGIYPPTAGGGLGNSGHSLDNNDDNQNEGSIGLSYKGKYLSWDETGATTGAIEVK